MTMYDYPITGQVGGGLYNSFWNSDIWNNFVDYVIAKSGPIDIAEGRLLFASELRLWNAFHDEDYNTIYFKSDADRTLFLLRFS